jgi:hypothetical protein
MRNFIHFAGSAIMWGVFGYYWYVVLERGIDRATLRAVETLAIIVLSGLLVTLFWVRYNLRLARRNRRRVSREVPDEQLTHDTLRRPVVAPDLAGLKRAAVVGIRIDDEGRKVYLAPGAAAPETDS